MNNTTHKAASPIKLKSGDWGVKVQGPAAKGTVVQVTTRSGKSWMAQVSRVIWSGNGVSICSTVSVSGRPSRRAAWAERSCCGYPCPVTGRKCTPQDPCHDCQ